MYWIPRFDARALLIEGGERLTVQVGGVLVVGLRLRELDLGRLELGLGRLEISIRLKEGEHADGQQQTGSHGIHNRRDGAQEREDRCDHASEEAGGDFEADGDCGPH